MEAMIVLWGETEYAQRTTLVSLRVLGVAIRKETLHSEVTALDPNTLRVI
jgi:hypothetical protein